MRQLPVRTGMTGRYTVKGNVLKWEVVQIIYIKSMLEISLTGAFGFQWDWYSEQWERNTLTFEKPVVYKFPITPITTELVHDNYLPEEGIEFRVFSLGGKRFFKFGGVPEDP
jgi:hypothetical protein